MASRFAIETDRLSFWYGTFQALYDVTLRIRANRITALIGPSGCGKTTLLRCFNRINERQADVRTTGRVLVLGQDIYAPEVDLIQLRKQVGMVFQRPNPLPLSIRENVLFGYHLHVPREERNTAEEERLLEEALRQVLLWDEVKDRLNGRATELSLEEQQKLCIARLLPLKPSILLMDEPCSALDPAATAAIEELIWELRDSYTIVLVTHNMAQARRASDECAFMLMGRLIEHGPTEEIFVTPRRKETADYIEGRYG
ncbi:MAG: phosphate ABC transporter ATP-binding protein PstB [Acidobacteriota bacterium]